MSQESHRRANAKWRTKNPNYKRDWYTRNAEQARAYSREFYVGREATYKNNARSWRKRNIKKAREAAKERYWKNPLHKCKQNRRWIAKTRERILDLYGRKCEICGFADVRALQLDHKHGVPQEDRGTRVRCGTGLYVAILAGRKDKSDFQLLCANHNTIKRMENREHTNRMRK